MFFCTCTRALRVCPYTVFSQTDTPESQPRAHGCGPGTPSGDTWSGYFSLTPASVQCSSVGRSTCLIIMMVPSSMSLSYGPSCPPALGSKSQSCLAYGAFRPANRCSKRIFLAGVSHIIPHSNFDTRIDPGSLLARHTRHLWNGRCNVSKFSATTPYLWPCKRQNLISDRGTRRASRGTAGRSQSARAEVLEVDVAIVGAGIIGISIAHQLLTTTSMSVALIDAAQPCAGATGAGTNPLL